MIGTLLANRYRIQGKIGEGGMAVVYRALDVVLQRVVAIKVLRPQYAGDEEFVDRFLREAQAAASLSHPNVVNIFDVGREGDVHYIVLEFVEGKNLKEILREHGRLSPRRAAQVARAVARALEAAHARGLIHRDVKPHNILITTEGRVKVADFGLARAASSSTLTETGKVIGSVHYFSPEQARGEAVGPASDIYSLGVVLYEMLTGKRPFDGDSPIAVALKHLQEDPVPPRQLDPRIPVWLEQVVLRAMAKKPADRFPTAAAMAEALEWRDEAPAAAASLPAAGGLPRRADGGARARVGAAVKGGGNDLPSPLDGRGRLRRAPERDEQRAVPAGFRSEEESDGAEATAETAAAADGRGRKRRGRRWLWVAATFLVLFAALYVARPYVLALVFPPEVTVPNVVGLTYEEARPLMVAAGLTLEIEAEQFHPDYPAGVIVRQNPAADRTVRQGRSIRVVLSRGPEMGVVPDVVGMALREARVAVTQAGFTLGEEFDDFTSSAAVNVVTGQDPPPGTAAQIGTPIHLWVSRPPALANQTVVVPDLRGRSLEEATGELEALGLVIGNRWPELRPLIPAGLVLDQNPEPGAAVPPGSAVDVVYSQGLPGAAAGSPAQPSSFPQGSPPEPVEVDWGAVIIDEAQSQRRRARVDVEVPAGRAQEVVILIIDDFGAREVFRQTVPGGTTLHEFVEARGQQARVQVYVGGVMYMDEPFPD